MLPKRDEFLLSPSDPELVLDCAAALVAPAPVALAHKAALLTQHCQILVTAMACCRGRRLFSADQRAYLS